LAKAEAAAPEPPPIRVAYNYCTLSYTFAYYSDEEWDAEIDRLAKAGYNAALVLDGTFKVWQAMLRELGYGEEAIAAFIPDECARAWWLMDNLYGEGGPLDQATIDADGARGRRICAKMREKGIEPILQGFFGMWVDDKTGSVKVDGLKIIPQGRWQCYTRPPVIDPTCPAFAKLAATWYRNLEAVYGFKPKYLAGDLFHEGGRSNGVDVTAAARAVQTAQQAAFHGVTWVVQAWGRNPTPALRAGLDPKLTLIEALVPQMNVFDKDGSTFDREWGEFPWVWCEVLNFGGKHGLHGNLKTFARLGRAAKGKGAKTFRGYGALSEGFFTNPVCYDLFDEMMMRPAGSEMTDAELAAWLDNWVDNRYGLVDSNPNLKLQLHQAWRILADTVYACPRDHGGPFENLMCAKPAWDVKRASSWAPKAGPWYDNAKLKEALDLMSAAAAECKSPNLAFDVYDVRRQVLANRFRELLPGLKAGDAAARKECEEIFASICSGADNIASVPPEFRLATYEDRARKRAGERGVRAWRRMITSWSDDAKYGRSSLAEYAEREYAELMRDYYIPRWREFLANPASGRKSAPDLDYDMGGDDSPRAPALPGMTLAAIKGLDLACRFRGEHIASKGGVGKGCNVRPTPDGKGLRVEFQMRDDKYIKCVLVDLTDGEGGVYARKVGTGFRATSGDAYVGIRFGDISGRMDYDIYDLSAVPPSAVGESLLPVIPQPTEWKPAAGECDLTSAKVDEKVDASSGLGEEGYTMKIAPGKIEIVAGGETGAVWARQTLAQLKVHGAASQCGEIRDVPKYRVRGFMLDVGRLYHSMEFLYDVARTMSYYKMNTFHIHLNDNEIVRPQHAQTADWSNKYAAFRMECETYPELTAKDGRYTKKEFRDFMVFCKSIGVTVIPEFDVPAHALAFTRVRPDFASTKYGADHFDLDKSGEILAWLKPLFAEYMTGDEPVFIGPYMHIGTDEYNKAEAEKFRAFTDAMLKMVKGFGFKPCAWGALSHARGETSVVAGADITMDIWHNAYYNPEEALKAGYTIVSIPDKHVYIIPFRYDWLDYRKLYETWEPRNVGRYTVPDKYMNQLAGGKFAVWNDRCGWKGKGVRYTEAENWDRIHPALQTLAQKFWRGADTGMGWDSFAALADSMTEPQGVTSTHAKKLAK